MLLLSLACFLPGLLLHEWLHLLTFQALGEPAHLLITSWRFSLIDLSIPGLHVAADHATGFDQLIDSFAGPAMAAIVVFTVGSLLPWRLLRSALFANVAALEFFVLVETLDAALDLYRGSAYPWLASPELDYGAVLLIFLAAAAISGLRTSRPSAGGLNPPLPPTRVRPE